jgi:hypothetical protein
VPQTHKNGPSLYHTAMDTYSRQGVIGSSPTSQNIPHTIFSMGYLPHHATRNFDFTVGFGLDVASYSYRQSPSLNHRKAHHTPSYLSHPAYVLSPPLLPIPRNPLPFKPDHGRRTLPSLQLITAIHRCRPQRLPPTYIEQSNFDIFIPAA